MKGEPEMALEILEPLSGKYPNTKEIVNNIAIANRMMGKYDTALELYDQANSLGAPQKNNKGILFIKTADYDLSINTFESDRYDYNRALAYTLKQDFNGAKDVLEKIEDKSADDFYLRAIVGARTKDVELMSTSLTRAIKLDSSIRERAKGDYEFRHYWDKTEFQNAIR
jgi:tetratricopeptide (TPR) repeat protein